MSNQRSEPFPLYSSPPSLSSPPTFSEGFASIGSLIRNKKNIVVVVGAGISTASGIPDFRSKGTGLYETLDIAALGLTCAEDLFDLESFQHDPRPFYRFAKSLYPGAQNGTTDLAPTSTHEFLALLSRRNQLRRVYTQNIDGLEERAGVPLSKIVACHGSLNWARCQTCKNKVEVTKTSRVMDDILKGRVPKCRKERGNSGAKSMKVSPKDHGGADCSSQTNAESAASATSNRATKRQRRQSSKLSDTSWSYAFDDVGDGETFSRDLDESDTLGCCGGVLKPGITFFGEPLPKYVSKRLEADRDKADCLIVIGTSLSVAPISKVIQYLSPDIPRILVNRNIVRPPNECVDTDGAETRNGYIFDACCLGFCDDISRALAKELEEGRLDDEQKLDNGNDAGTVLWSNKDACIEKDGATCEPGLHCHPTHRIFLFSGASIGGDEIDSSASFREIARCDGCEEDINGSLWKCSECFDYDLCQRCYPSVSKKHFDGKHTFLVEEM